MNATERKVLLPREAQIVACSQTLAAARFTDRGPHTYPYGGSAIIRLGGSSPTKKVRHGVPHDAAPRHPVVDKSFYLF